MKAAADPFPIVDRSDLPGLRDAVGEEELLRWIAYYHERQELKVRQCSNNAVALRLSGMRTPCPCTGVRCGRLA